MYHYQGMPLHYLTEDEEYAVYQAKYNPEDKPAVRFNPFVVYRLQRRYTVSNGWVLRHHRVARFGDLYSAVLHIRKEQGRA